MFKDISIALDWLYNQKKLKPRDDLSRIKKCIELLKIKTPYKIIHIAGTNGKGSTASYLKNMLMLDNKKVGFFVSPYVICFNERIQINDEYISDSNVLKYLSILKKFSAEYQTKFNDTIPFFELTFLMALLYFQAKKIDIAIIECGLGGLLDATNCLDTTVSVITNIGYDHQAQLGSTLKEIANHKLGIIKKNRPCFTGVSSELKEYFKTYAVNLSAPITFIEEEVNNIHYNANQLSFCYKGKSYMTTLAGSYQAYNASLAMAVMEYLNPNFPKTLTDLALLNTKWPGRFEEIIPNVILDGAHNLDGTFALVNSLKLKYPNRHIKVVFTALKDKAIKDMLKLLDEITDFYFFTTIDDKRATSTEIFKSLTIKPYKLFTNYKEAIDLAINFRDSCIIVITGSLHFISQAREFLINERS